MKYFIRSIKYMIFFMVLCGLVIVITFYTSTPADGVTLKDVLMANGSMYKMLAFFAFFAAIYPALGFSKKQIYVSNFKENKNQIIDLFTNAKYVIADESATTITFRLRSNVMRLFRMYEDYVVIDFSDNPVIIEGLRKDVLRFSRGIEYICQKEQE